MAPIVGAAILEKHAAFKDWTILPKIMGKDPGFIAESPDQTQRIYFKCTNNMLNELFAARVLTHLGVKVAETTLFVDDQGNCFLGTRGLSRQYTKTGAAKSKAFAPLMGLLPDAVTLSIGYDAAIDGARETHLPEMNAFVDTLFQQDSARISFAKLALMGFSLGLTDVATHGGNIGILTSSKEGKTHQKWSIVDYQVYTTSLSSIESSSALLESLKKSFSGNSPVFKAMLEKLTLADLEQAIAEIANPKVYEENPQGYYLTARDSKSSYKAAIEKAFEETKDILHGNGLDSAEAVQSLEKQKEIIMANLGIITACRDHLTPSGFSL